MSECHKTAYEAHGCDITSMSKNGDHLKVFEGEAKGWLPLFRSDHVVSGTFEILGKMIALSPVQCRISIPGSSSDSYISTGDLQAALLHVSAVNVCDPTLKTVDINYVRMYISQPYIKIATSHLYLNH